MRRRDFITLVVVAAARPFAARAEPQEHMRLIGVLMGYEVSDSEGRAQIAAFRDRLKKLGWTEDHNARIEARWAAPTDAAAMQRSAKELVALQPDIIPTLGAICLSSSIHLLACVGSETLKPVVTSTTPSTTATAVLQQTRTIPVVFAAVGDPIGSGFVASFRRPGGNAASLAARNRLPAVYPPLPDRHHRTPPRMRTPAHL
jgi:putative ABC transport system substrate-binding protein